MISAFWWLKLAKYLLRQSFLTADEFALEPHANCSQLQLTTLVKTPY
uniref:Uncharacterized protein n=1 Tax=Rhizophora mucronata TaxID=61149 RepID=A0A2P2NKY1_RHIMU